MLITHTHLVPTPGAFLTTLVTALRKGNGSRRLKTQQGGHESHTFNVQLHAPQPGKYNTPETQPFPCRWQNVALTFFWQRLTHLKLLA